MDSKVFNKYMQEIYAVDSVEIKGADMEDKFFF